MHSTTIAQMAVTALLVALLPLSLVWTSSDANKYRKLVWVSVFLTFDLIVFGAFTRLTDSGLGCPDWPGCYGAANPFLAHEQITAAEALLPTGPVTVVKAWIEMIHRYPGDGDRRADRGDAGAIHLPVAQVEGHAAGIRAVAAGAAVRLCLPAGRVRRLDRHLEAAAGHRHHPPVAGHGPCSRCWRGTAVGRTS